ncbi:MAG: hypothetical protein O7A06_14395 [Acidobacteria bacterium]|nr:hypothetical protein [Acidobacteriota bacterium]
MLNGLKKELTARRRQSDLVAFADKLGRISHSNISCLEFLCGLLEELHYDCPLSNALNSLFDLYFAAGQFPKATDVLHRLVDLDSYDPQCPAKLERLEGKVDPGAWNDLAVLMGKSPASAEEEAPGKAEGEEGGNVLDDLILQAEIYGEYNLETKARDLLERIAKLFPREEEKNQRLRKLFRQACFSPKYPDLPAKPAKAEPASTEVDMSHDARISGVSENPAEKIEHLTRLPEEKDREHERLLEELDAAHRQLREERETVKTQILQMEIHRNEIRSEIELTSARQVEQESLVDALKTERQDLVQKLAAKEQEFGISRQHSNDALAQVRSLEATLNHAEKRSNELQADLASQKALVENLRANRSKGRRTKKAQHDEANLSANTSHAVKGTEPLPPNKADDLYMQAITPLTVLRASADLLAIDSKADASLRETTGVIKVQSQVLLDLIKSHAFPAEIQSNGSY